MANEPGGIEAALKLRASTTKYLEEAFSGLRSDLKVLILVCCDLKGLSSTLYNNSVIERPKDFLEFVRGFNKAHPMCYFIDAGSGKECSDDKLQGRLKSVTCRCLSSRGVWLTLVVQRCSSSISSRYSVNMSFLVVLPTTDTPGCFVDTLQMTKLGNA